MALIRSAKLARDLYWPELLELVDYGEPVDVRGRKTLEILNVVTEVQEPWHHCILLPARRWNPWLAMSEALWILAGRNDVAALLPYNKNIVNYSDDGVHLYGAYGARIYEQIDELIERLRRDPSDRRAVLQIWDHTSIFDGWPMNRDLTTDSKDPPCNNMVYFKLRNNKLHMTVICRSNDIHWGLYAVNLPTFGILQVYIAARLGVEVGAQTHLSNSLHVYTDDKAAAEITDRMLYKEPNVLPVYPEHGLAFTSNDVLTEPRTFSSHAKFSEYCSDILDSSLKIAYGFPPFLQFAGSFLKQYRNHVWEPDLLLHRERFQDWVAAGQLFVDKVWKQPANVS